MELAGLALILAAVFVWSVISARITVISAPIFFVACGLVLAGGERFAHFSPDPHANKLMAEITLVWVLFADASRVRVPSLRRDAARYVRLLAVGLPLTVVFGSLVAHGLLGVGLWFAVLLGAALAPTDAALGAAVMSDKRVPYAIRQTLNVESGLNDGIATPIVTTALAAIAIEAGHVGGLGFARALLALPLGLAVGAVMGAIGGLVLRWSHRRGWGAETVAGPGVLALALLAFVVADLASANGYVAAFVAGMAFGSTAGRGEEAEVYYVEQTCGLASMLCWLLFGAVAVPDLVADWSWRILGYALLSLTVIRMIPVALVLLGTRIGWRSTVFIGWFGPRGLASVVFALIAAEDLHDVSRAAQEVVAAIGLTVLLSVLLHGLTARPLIGWYSRHEKVGDDAHDRDDVAVRHLAKPRAERD